MLPITLTLINIFIPMPQGFIPDDFFLNIINNPFDNMSALMIFGGLCAAFVAGIVYCVRRDIEKQRGY